MVYSWCPSSGWQVSDHVVEVSKMVIVTGLIPVQTSIYVGTPAHGIKADSSWTFPILVSTISAIMDNADSGGQVGGSGEDRNPGELLGDHTRMIQDAKMIRRAIRQGWNISPERKAALVARLADIVAKTSVDVITANGQEPSEYHADSNSIAAARVLVAAEGQDRADAINDERNRRLDEGKPTENVQHVKLEFDKDG